MDRASRDNTNEESSSKCIGSPGTNKNSAGAKAPKNEKFYVHKRGLFRKADQVVKSINCDIFITIHYKENDKIYTYANDQNFTIGRVSELILRDMTTSAFLNKNKKFEDVDFDQVQQQVKKINGLEKNYNIKNTKLNHNHSVNDPSDDTGLKFTSLTPSEVEDASYSQQDAPQTKKKQASTQQFAVQKSYDYEKTLEPGK